MMFVAIQNAPTELHFAALRNDLRVRPVPSRREASLVFESVFVKCTPTTIIATSSAVIIERLLLELTGLFRFDLVEFRYFVCRSTTQAAYKILHKSQAYGRLEIIFFQNPPESAIRVDESIKRMRRGTSFKPNM
jgi:hypothetical protein